VLKGDAIPNYKFLINVDNTGDPTQDRYAGCSLRAQATRILHRLPSGLCRALP
jgi:hypothetical protein